jgi:hypothetical protein
MTTKTIPAYLEEERQKNRDAHLRMEAEAARIQPLPPSHWETTQAGIANCGENRTQSKKDRGTSPEKATHRAKGGDESPQGSVNSSVNPRLRSQA